MTETTVTVRPETVLVKFQFTNRKLIPREIRKVERNKKQIEEKRRSNGVLTGEHTVGENVCIRPFVVQLFKFGYFLDVHYYENKDEDHWNTKYVLVLNFTKQKIPSKKLLRQTVMQLSQLTDKDAWGYIHYHRNPNGVWSLTCLHRLPNNTNDHEIGELFFEAPEDEPEKYIHERI